MRRGERCKCLTPKRQLPLSLVYQFRSALYEWKHGPQSSSGGSADEGSASAPTPPVVGGDKEQVKQEEEEEEEAEDPSECIPLQLQKLFGQLQLSDETCVETRALTDSFGWTAQASALSRRGLVVFGTMGRQDVGRGRPTVSSRRGKIDLQTCCKRFSVDGGATPPGYSPVFDVFVCPYAADPVTRLLPRQVFFHCLQVRSWTSQMPRVFPVRVHRQVSVCP